MASGWSSYLSQKGEAVYPATCFSADLAFQLLQCFEATFQCLSVPDAAAKPPFYPSFPAWR